MFQPCVSLQSHHRCSSGVDDEKGGDIHRSLLVYEAGSSILRWRCQIVVALSTYKAPLSNELSCNVEAEDV